MMKRLCTALVLSLTLTAAISAQDRIAVLDTELPKGIDVKVVIPVTEKIMEEFVRSKLFTVLDRSFIARTLAELEFSTSDLTAGDTDKLATIGGFLKATYIVVSTVQLLDRTYFLSAKMIEVKSGVIVAQSSVNRDGSVSVLIDMAGELGQKLVSAAMGQEAKPSGRTATQQTAPATTKEPIAAKPARNTLARSTRFSTVTADFGSVATYAVVTDIDGEWDLYSFKFTSTSDPLIATGFSYGASGVFPTGIFYISTGISLADTSNEFYNSYYSSYFNSITETIDAYLGLGIDLPIGPVIIYGGPRIGYSYVDSYLEDEDGYLESSLYSNIWSGLGYGFEIGADIRLGVFALGVRYGSLSGNLISDIDDSELSYTNGALSLRVGIAY